MKIVKYSVSGIMLLNALNYANYHFGLIGEDSCSQRLYRYCHEYNFINNTDFKVYRLFNKYIISDSDVIEQVSLL